MAQIFVSHSAKDRDLVNFFSNAFAGTKVKAIFEEFEKIEGKITPSKVMRDIENSNAIFVILSKNVQNIPHTRDWVVWETGVAKNRDIWVFEPYSQFGEISVVIPFLRNYVIFATNDPWLGYIRRIIESYDDSHILPTVLITTLTGAGIGAALSDKNKTKGVFLGGSVGAITGLAISEKLKERPMGLRVRCKSCSLLYNIHIPQETKIFRCPVCNKYWQIKL